MERRGPRTQCSIKDGSTESDTKTSALIKIDALSGVRLVVHTIGGGSAQLLDLHELRQGGQTSGLLPLA